MLTSFFRNFKRELFSKKFTNFSSVHSNRWHLITIGIIPPKRPFAHTQILSYVDGHQKLGATIKFGAFSEPFIHCTIGNAYQRARRSSNNEKDSTEKLQTSTSIDSATGAPKGMFPSLMERAFLPQIVSQVRFIHSIRLHFS